MSSTSSGVQVRILGRVSVPSWAVGLRALVRSAGLPCFPALDIHLLSNWLEVIRTNARWSAAQVVERKPFGDWSDQRCVCEPVGIDDLRAVPKTSVPESGLATDPEPATIRDVDFLPKPFLWGARRAGEPSGERILHHSVIVAGAN